VSLVARDFLSMSRRELQERLRHGHPIDPGSLDDSEYRGISLGLPSILVKLTWLTFRKTFHRDPKTARLRGWNVRMKQTGLDGPAEPLRSKDGSPRCFGFYDVVEARGHAMPIPCPQGLLIDYGATRARDPIVAVHEGSRELLLGWTYLDLGVARVGTPSFFVLEREGPLSFVPPAAG
jgi:hypothetical protein